MELAFGLLPHTWKHIERGLLMNKQPPVTPGQRLKRSESVLDILEEVLHLELETDTTCQLPPGLRDPVRVMEQVRALLQNETPWAAALQSETEETTCDLEEYRAAARNGSPIPTEVLTRMHQEREQAEAVASLEGH
jgi:hypothetical protein